MKILFLILASDGGVYTELQAIWRSYIHKWPETIEAYFYKANPRLATEYDISGDVVTVRCSENLASVAKKLQLALKAFEPRLSEFTYICRPNLSSFFILDRYLKMLEPLPRERLCFAKEHLHPAVFPTGAGFTISPDIAKAILAHPFPQHVTGGDDVAVGGVLKEMGIKIRNTARIDFTDRRHWDQRLEMVKKDSAIFHLRVKHEIPSRCATDLELHRIFLNLFY